MPPRELIEKIKIGLIIGAILAVLISYVFAILKRRFRENKEAEELWLKTPVIDIAGFRLNAVQSLTACLLFMAMAGTVNYSSYSHFSTGTRVDEYDMLHYYVTPKYFDELGYFNLLPAMIIADAENGRHCAANTRIYLHQTREDYMQKPIEYALSIKDEVKSRFTDERWRQFTHDVLYLQREIKPMGCSLWRQLLQDHGFNGTPVWTTVARPIVSLVPVEKIRIIANLDVLWLGAALFAVAWAFGVRTFAFAWIFLTVCYSMRWPTAGWALLRYDWISSIIIGLCALKKEKYALSGAFFGYATLLRYFPGVWLFGVFAKGMHALFTRRDIPVRQFWKRIPARYYRMALGFFAVVIVLFTLSVPSVGIQAHRDSFSNMKAHVQPHNLSSRRMGLALVPAYRGELDIKWITAEKKEIVAKWEGAIRVISIAAMLFLGLFMSRIKDWEATGLGFMPFFWLTTSSYYYYVVLASAVIIHAKSIHRSWHLFGLLMLFAVQLIFHVGEYFLPEMRYPTISLVCVALTIYSIGIMTFLGRNWWRTRTLPPPE